MSAEPPVCAVLGAGVMGAQIALSLALGGARTRLWARRPESLPDAMGRCAEAVGFLVGEGVAEAGEGEAALARIGAESDLAKAVGGAGFVIEAVAEDLAAKRELLARAEAHAGRQAILSSTTSAISPTAIQSALARPENFCVAHYAQPAHLVGLVEVVPGERTSGRAREACAETLSATGKLPVLCPDVPGFLWARIQHAVLREFATLVGRGLVAPEACDTVLKKGYALRLPAMGAFEHADLAGLDLVGSPAARAVWADLSNVADPDDTPVGRLRVEGRLGMKTGSGFYDWSAEEAEAFKLARDREIVRRLRLEREAEID